MDVVLREADEADAAALADLHVRTFNETHGPGPTHAVRLPQWQAALADPSPDSFCVVLEDGAGQLIGFARAHRYLDGGIPDIEGHLNKIYLLRERHGYGLGRALLCAVSRRFVQRGITSMLLFGDARSPANRFYEAMGGQRLHAPNGEFHGGYAWRDLAPLAESCGEE